MDPRRLRKIIEKLLEQRPYICSLEIYERFQRAQNLSEEEKPTWWDVSQIWDELQQCPKRTEQEVPEVQVEIMKPRPQPKTHGEQKNQNGFLIICPSCQSPQVYHKRSTTRAHTYCKVCHKHIELRSFDLRTPTEVESAQNIEEKQEQLTKLSLELSHSDIDILESFFDTGKNEWVVRTQGELTSITKKNRSTISRRLKILKELNLIEEFPGSVKTYRVVPNNPYAMKHEGTIREKPEGAEYGVQIHHKNLIWKIVAGRESPRLTALFERTSKMNNWRYYYFHVNGMEFRVSDKSLFFSPTAIGKDTDHALTNLKKKIENIGHYFSEELGVSLGKLDSPNDKFRDQRGPHWVPFLADGSADFNDDGSDLAWTDKSHPNKLESHSKTFVQDILDMRTHMIDLHKQTDEINQKVDEIHTQRNTIDPNLVKELERKFLHEFDKFKIDLKNEIRNELVPALTSAFFEAFSKFSSGNGGVQPPPPPSTYI